MGPPYNFVRVYTLGRYGVKQRTLPSIHWNAVQPEVKPCLLVAHGELQY